MRRTNNILSHVKMRILGARISDGLNNYIIRLCIVVLIERFWTAPEHLNIIKGMSQEGDVYSFGVILYEIITRQDPFSDYDVGPKGTQQNMIPFGYH